MKTRAEIADHPKARLHRELVALLRAAGSIEGARGVLRICLTQAPTDDRTAPKYGPKRMQPKPAADAECAI